MSSKKRFTYREAKDLIPRVKDLAQAAFQRAEYLLRDMRIVELTPDRRAELEGEYAQIISKWAEEIGRIGCRIKGLWLVDFDNGNGYYC